MREQLVAAVGAGGDDRVGLLGGERLRPGRGLVVAVDRDRTHVADRAREAGRLRRKVVLVDKAENGHATPIDCSTATTWAASSSTSACFPCPSGTRRRSFSSSAVRGDGSTTASGFDFARSLPGTEG